MCTVESLAPAEKSNALHNLRPKARAFRESAFRSNYLLKLEEAKNVL